MLNKKLLNIKHQNISGLLYRSGSRVEKNPRINKIMNSIVIYSKLLQSYLTLRVPHFIGLNQIAQLLLELNINKAVRIINPFSGWLWIFNQQDRAFIFFYKTLLLQKSIRLCQLYNVLNFREYFYDAFVTYSHLCLKFAMGQRKTVFQQMETLETIFYLQMELHWKLKKMNISYKSRCADVEWKCALIWCSSPLKFIENENWKSVKSFMN